MGDVGVIARVLTCRSDPPLLGALKLFDGETYLLARGKDDGRVRLEAPSLEVSYEGGSRRRCGCASRGKAGLQRKEVGAEALHSLPQPNGTIDGFVMLR